MMYDFTDSVVLVTGGSRGIGLAIAEHFGKAKAKVIILGRNQESLDSAIKQLKDQGFDAAGYQASVSDSARMEEVFASVIKDHGKIDVLINNAGVTKDNLLLRMKEEDWESVMDINLKGAFVCTQKAFKHMMRARKGSIINISSVIGLIGNAGQANYAASKGGIIAFTKSCAKEFAPRNIRVNAIAPGFIETEMTAELPDDVRAEYAKVIPLGKMGNAAEVAQVCLFLASENSSYITGQTIAVDGGLTMY
ncbi:MAG: 3-oxoacyl-[acyl-carrier-protein] reductase [Candidatus Cloacimonetes bacterium]|jgi:3-oxoacyl-[acyl-carrier protein] reductase|nr:3-oxoacyl-[acyl-carrier-protein] reductase [Candidatus Cloacimonadota bacterium]NLO44587.1 3-oxoacyl-[acyl-carrier-protein] reductase [Candidatus Cloacimonadota bacterium]